MRESERASFGLEGDFLIGFKKVADLTVWYCFERRISVTLISCCGKAHHLLLNRRSNMNKIFSFTISFLLISACAIAQDVNPVNISFQRDDITLYGKFFPAERDNPSPTLLLLPGFPGSDNDVLGLGKRVSELGLNVMMFNYSGTHKSEGLLGLQSVQDDISEALSFLHKPENKERYRIDTSLIVLGGYSYGGGMAMTYAVTHPEVNIVVSIAGNDWGEHFEDYVNVPWMKTAINGIIENSESSGLVRFDEGERPAEFLAEGTGNLDTSLYLKRNADDLADRKILLIAGWDDQGVVLERYTLPLYRALKEQGARNVKIVAFQDDHSFSKSRDDIAQAIVEWVK